MDDYKNVHLVVAIPTVDYVNWQFVKCLIKLVRRLDELKINNSVLLEGGSLVYLARDRIVTKAIQDGYTHILWLDADMIFEADIFEKLYHTQNDQMAPLTTGIYNSRHGDRKPVLWTSLDPSERMNSYPEADIFEIEGCGFGCCLTRVDMMADIWDHCGTCFLPTIQHGEDLAFCKRAIDIRGYNMVADARVKCGHISQEIVMPKI